MTTQQTPGQVKEHYSRVLGPEWGAVFHELVRELLWAKSKWDEYLTLFAVSSKRVALLNSLARWFWWNVQTVMWDDVLLHIARLTEKSEKNLTIRRLPKMCKDKEIQDHLAARIDGADSATQFARDLAARIDDADSATRFARDWRHRRIAHRDLKTTLKVERSRPLAPARKADVESALQSIHAVLNVIRERLLDEATTKEIVYVRSPVGAVGLVAEIRVLVNVAFRFADLIGMKGDKGDVESTCAVLARMGCTSKVEQLETAYELLEIVQKFRKYRDEGQLGRGARR